MACRVHFCFQLPCIVNLATICHRLRSHHLLMEISPGINLLLTMSPEIDTLLQVLGTLFHACMQPCLWTAIFQAATPHAHESGLPLSPDQAARYASIQSPSINHVVIVDSHIKEASVALRGIRQCQELAVQRHCHEWSYLILAPRTSSSNNLSGF